MFYYGIQSWGNQELLFIHQMTALNNLCAYINYIKRGYKKYQTNKGSKKRKNILILYKLIDDYGWSSLMFRTMESLPLESNNILNLTSTYEYKKMDNIEIY